jgi:glycine/D-amino acid oxidase-like deaminating enzyme
VAIVGAGFTGLWTAYYLHQRDPSLRIVVVEAEIAGFGASGRNGGWASALLPMSLDAVAKTAGGDRQAAVDLQDEMHRSVDELARAAGELGIEFDHAKGGYLHVATNPAQLPRLHEELASWREWGYGDEHHRLLTREETLGEVGIPHALGALFTPHCAAIQPAKLARGLAAAVERRGVTIHERSPVSAIEPGRVRTAAGRVRARHVVRATEGYTPRLAGERRTVAPLYSLMIATEPLDESFWAGAGLHRRATFDDGRPLLIYGQRTADGRFAFGGRGAPYHFGSRLADGFDRHDRVHADLRRVLGRLFPALGDTPVTHRWGGPLAAPRDWRCSVGLDRSTGLAWAGGYVGDGVTTTNLAGRTLADLLTNTDSELTRLAWVDHRSRRWEPEPLRWIGINGSLKLAAWSDRSEARTGRPATRRERLGERIRGV